MNVLLPLMILLPLAAAVLMMILRSPGGNLARVIALVGSLATLVVSLVLVGQFQSLPVVDDPSAGPVQPRVELRHAWMTYAEAPHAVDGDNITPRQIKLEFFLGLDGISLSLAVLTALLTLSSVLISWDAIRERATEFYACLLLLETGLIGAFCAFDILLFYVFFEFTLIPLFFLIGMWGGPQRRYAAVKFFLYTLAGSLVTLVGLVALVLAVLGRGLDTPFSIPDMARTLAADPIAPSLQVWLFLALSAGFMIKVPLFPFHTWLPLAHVEAPTAGSVILAGVLLKLGTYGFLRLCLPMLPEACVTVGVPLVATLSVIGILYGALCALAQNDIKRLVAYSSISHLGFCMLGLFALNVEGISGSVLQMINHGLSTGGLFLLVGMVYERYHTRLFTEIGGLASKLPLISISMVFICLASVGLPGLNGFIGEVLSLIGMFKVHPAYAVIGTSGIILGAWYLLTLLQKGFFGPLREPHHDRSHGNHEEGHAAIRDLNFREFASFAPLAALCLWIGVYPQPLLETIRPDVEAVAALYQDGRVNTVRVQSVGEGRSHAEREDDAISVSQHIGGRGAAAPR